LRIRIEQTIGWLKNCFVYLKEIPNKGNLSQDQLKEIYKRIASVVILHNLLETENPWLEVELVEEDDGGEGRGSHDEVCEVDEKEFDAQDRGVLRRELFLREFVVQEPDEE